MSINIATAVEDFWTARARGEFFPQAYVDRLDLDQAYRIQLALIDRPWRGRLDQLETSREQMIGGVGCRWRAQAGFARQLVERGR